MKIAGRQFKPAWWAWILTSAVVALFIMLGLWQMDRAAYKQTVQDNFEQRLAREFEVFDVDEDLLNADLEDIEYRKILLRGRYDNAQNFLLDNQVYRGRAGYHVLTPFYLVNSRAVILVNRGWVVAGASRQQLPQIEPASQVEQIAGIARIPTEPALQLGEIELSGNWPQLISHIDLALLGESFSGELLPIMLWLAPQQEDVYVRDWNPIWLPPEKSRAYAVQWFAFAFVVFALFLILNLRKTE